HRRAARLPRPRTRRQPRDEPRFVVRLHAAAPVSRERRQRRRGDRRSDRPRPHAEGSVGRHRRRAGATRRGLDVAMTHYANVRARVPQLIERIERAVEHNDMGALDDLDVEVRRLVATLLATPTADTAEVLADLADFYRSQLVRCEARRDALKNSIGAQHRARVGAAAYRSSGAVSLNA